MFLDENCWPVTRDSGIITKIENERPSKNGPFIMFEITDKMSGITRRIQAWQQAYQLLKYGVYKLGSDVCVDGYLHFYDGYNDKKAIAIKTKNIYNSGSKATVRIKITSDWFKGHSVGKDIQAFSGKIILPEGHNSGLVVHVYMNRCDVLWRQVKKGAIVDVTGTYHISKEPVGDRIILNNISAIEEVQDV